MTIYVISDLHLDEHGEARLFDDERQGRLLAELCGRVERDEGSELVLLGDCFDFTAMQPPPKGLDRFFRSLDVPRQVPPRRTLPQLLEAVRASNPVAFEALAQLAGKAPVTVVPGNHDHHLGARSAAQELASAGIAARLEPCVVRELGGSKVVLLHGHELDEGNDKPGGSGEVMTNVLHQAVIPFLRHRGPPPNVRFDPDRLVALRPEEAVVSVLQRWLPEEAFDKFFRAFLRLLAENGYLPQPLAWLAGFISANRVRSSVAKHDQLWERTGLRAIDALKGKATLPRKAPRPDALVLGHTHVLDWAVHVGRLYVNLGTWTERAFDASSPRDSSLPVLRLDAPEGRLVATLTDLAAGDRELQRFESS
jgi:UDP-2,3-diacylglucosamine pyrophosphatase LpxH